MTRAQSTDRQQASALVPAVVIPPQVTDEDLARLSDAVAVLDGTSLAARLNALVGRQIDLAAQVVPAPLLSVVNNATARALRLALKGAVRTLGSKTGKRPRSGLHVAAAAVAGAAGGAFGLSALPVELPVSTTIMLRCIAEIARDAGEDLADPETLLACLEVFALGNGSDNGPAGESGYLATRSLLAKSITEAARFIVQRGATDEAAPAILRLLAQISARFGVAVGQKTLAQAVPVIGAVTGAAINASFTSHFQAMASAHFAVRSLERRYGAEVIRGLFEELRGKAGHDASPISPADAKALPAR